MSPTLNEHHDFTIESVVSEELTNSGSLSSVSFSSDPSIFLSTGFGTNERSLDARLFIISVTFVMSFVNSLLL